jgi:serine/threonine protein kinase
MLNDDQPFAPNDKGAPAARPPLVPGHRLLRQIAHGSYGEIWLARTELGAYRAVKIIRRANFTNAKPYDREFAGIQRYEPVSREHEGLVDVLQVGRDEAAGYFYYVMELADDASRAPLNTNSTGSAGIRAGEFANPGPRQPAGKDASAPGSCAPAQAPPAHSPTFSPAGYAPLTLAHAILARTRLPASEVVTLGISLARALEFLHSRRLVHRDIKPSNIIFLGGQPKLADVGLIADLGGPLTFVGTEGYFPPEGPGTAQADIYSLGKVLYEAATGKDRQEFPDLPTDLNVLPGVPPAEPTERFKNGTAGGTHGSTLSRSPSSCVIPESGEPRNRLGETQDDLALLELNEVLLKACESNPRARYASAAAMAADLERIKAGQSLRNRRARRQRIRTIAVGSSLAAGIALLFVGLAALVQYERSKPQLIFRDDFDGPTLDTNLWSSSQADHGISGMGRRWFRVEPLGGELVLQSKAEHKGGDTSGKSVWLDLRGDLRLNSACRIEMEITGEADGGGFALAIVDANTQPRHHDPSGARLFDFRAYLEPEPLKLSAVRVRIELLPMWQAAVVYPDARRLDEFDVVDLNGMATWQLRLHCFASTSTGLQSGEADFRIKEIAAYTLPHSAGVVGRVVNELSGRPLADALIVDRLGRTLAKTRANGAFALPRGLDTQSLKVEKAGYYPSESRSWAASTNHALRTVRLRKTQEEFGDVVGVINYGSLVAQSIGFRGDTLTLLVQDSSTTCRLLPVDLVTGQIAPGGPGSTKLVFPDGNLVVGFVECGSRLIGFKHWKDAAIFDLTSEPPQLLLKLTHKHDGSPLYWPNGAAFDGQFLWFVEQDHANQRFGLHAIDLQRGAITNTLASAEAGICGLAWDGRHFWISTVKGEVSEIDRDAAWSAGRVEMGRGRRFPGYYDRLTFGQGFLWGLDIEKRLICKIKITD